MTEDERHNELMATLQVLARAVDNLGGDLLEGLNTLASAISAQESK